METRGVGWWLGLIVLSTATPSVAQQHSADDARRQHATDLAHRDRAIRWPKQYDPAAAAQFSHNELLVRASCERAFATMADVTKWPDWLVLVKNVATDRPTRAPAVGTTISLSIFGDPITARMTEWLVNDRMAWIPKSASSPDADHYHAWRFIPVAGKCRVVTEEVGVGPADRLSGATGSLQMHRAHDLWLASLRYASE